MKWKSIFFASALLQTAVGIGLLFDKETLIPAILILILANLNIFGYVYMRHSDD